MKKIAALFLSGFLLVGCVTTQTSDVFIQESITGPKVVAISGTRAPWVYEIENRLRKRGFKIKRMVSQTVAIETVSPTKTEAYKEASARFILHLDGYAPNTAMTRCFGGGYNFDYINIELIDVATNETALHYSSSGFSENCPPLSGTIFTDIVNLVSSLWE